jgi:hypothetical protein
MVNRPKTAGSRFSNAPLSKDKITDRRYFVRL